MTQNASFRSQGKLVHCGCGYPLWVGVLDDGFAQAIVVSYREAYRESVLLYHCPSCGKELRLWWDRPADWHERRQDIPSCLTM